METTPDATQLDALVAKLALMPDDLLLIGGGDGTVSLVLGALLRQSESDDKLPLILLVPAGTTNLVALDIHGQTNIRITLSRLKAILAQPSERWPVKRRPILRIKTGDGAPDQYGFVFGMGSFAEGVRYFNDKVRGGSLGQEWSASFAVARTLFRKGGNIASGFADATDVEFAIQNSALDDTDFDEATSQPARLSMLMASTLNRTLFRLHYHWAKDDAPIRYISFGAKTPRLVRALIAILFNRQPKWLLDSEHYQSGGVTQMSLRFSGPFILDGECFNATNTKLNLSATRRIPLLILSDRASYQ